MISPEVFSPNAGKRDENEFRIYIEVIWRSLHAMEFDAHALLLACVPSVTFMRKSHLCTKNKGILLYPH
jgi:hypothetical protein